jgi:hypothetical protein
MTGQQAVTALETKDDFDFIFRPSPRVRAWAKTAGRWCSGKRTYAA